MRKKILSILLVVLILPLSLVLMACGDVSSYPVTVFTSSDALGFVESSGSGSFEEGQEVVLTANIKSKNAYIIGWVHQNNTFLSEGNGYTIENTSGSNGQVVKSVLKFSSSTEKQGRYTAIFGGGKMQFSKFDSFYLTTDPSQEVQSDSTGKTPIATTSLQISHGSNDMQEVFSANDVTLYDNVLVPAQDVSQVLRLSSDRTYYFRANVTLAVNDMIVNKNLRADLTYLKNTPQMFDASNQVTSNVDFDGTTYKIVFQFEVGSQNFSMIFNYKNLQ